MKITRCIQSACLTLKALITAAADDIIYLFIYLFIYLLQRKEVLTFHVNRLADDSHEMSRLLFSGKNKTNECRLLQILLGALRVINGMELATGLTFMFRKYIL